MVKSIAYPCSPPPPKVGGQKRGGRKSKMFRIVFQDVLPCKIIVRDDGGSTHL
jgi:hypothetical protein